MIPSEKIFLAPVRKNNLYDKTREPTMNLSKEIYDFLAEPEGRREKEGGSCAPTGGPSTTADKHLLLYSQSMYI